MLDTGYLILDTGWWWFEVAWWKVRLISNNETIQQ